MSIQTELINLEDLVCCDHIYRKFIGIVNIPKLVSTHLKSAEGNSSYKGYGIELLFKALLLQHLEDLSDRELARYLTENTAAKWFCNLSLTSPTPDYTVFSRARKRIGANRLSKIFSAIRDQLMQHVTPSQGSVYADKGYCDINAKRQPLEKHYT